MLSIGLWRLYINITITILGIIHRPVFYLKLNSTLQVCPYLTGNITSSLRAQQLMLSMGLWRWYVNITITILDIIHRPVLHLKLNSIGLPVLHRRHITATLRAKRLMLSIRLWRWYINITITILDIMHHPVTKTLTLKGVQTVHRNERFHNTRHTVAFGIQL
jgi:hypothetical protein